MAVTAKEAFWKEHQDSLIRIRSQLSSHGKNTPANRKSPMSRGRKTHPVSNHPPLGKYRRTPPPYLPRVDSPGDAGHTTPPLRGHNFGVVPPVKPKKAFVRPKLDYDSWGEEESDDEDDDDNEADRRGLYKPKPYPQPSPMMMGAPFGMYYPPPPKGGGQPKRRKAGGGGGGTRGYRDLYRERQAHHQSLQGAPQKGQAPQARGRCPVHAGLHADAHDAHDGAHGWQVQVCKYIYGEEDSSEDEMDPLKHLNSHPQFGNSLVASLVAELLEEEIVPDVLMEALNEYDPDRWSYDHPAYLPTLYCCEDVMMDGIRDMLEDLVREVSSELAEDYLDEKRLGRDPLEDFLSSLLSDAVDLGVREVVRECVIGMAQQHLQDETASAIYNDVFREELKRAIPGVLEDIQADLIAEEFIEDEVIAAEVEEEAAAVANEILHHYDNKITRRELKEVTKKANGQLADSLLMEYMLSVIAHQGKIWTQDDYNERYLDDLILAVSMEQYYGVQKDRDRTLDNKPLKKLHEKAFTEVALDVSLQQLTASLDEDLADVDEYERGVIDEGGHPISLSES
ncbi:uncharacterized protein LOC143277570 [Babylonia areolata]|uniref:uncharacterized protein LOC143277570 n=1 Tax=Babylonia areolata TaxID=304850 RepID=UPI003FCFCBED